MRRSEVRQGRREVKDNFVKFTPLNITLACILVWFISELNLEGAQLFSLGWLIVLIVLLALLDLGFRLIFKDIKRLWWAQCGFLCVVALIVIVLKLT
ncbi:hypothetical protein G5B30_13540 [Sphingobacterium sp. SGG-5]|nr:hypothetical protein [Sphingobacterium sp. SGG-5]